MILYINGCSHTAAAEAVHPAAFAEDDGNYMHLGRRPHPLNLVASWGYKLGDLLNVESYIDAESAAGNDRIIRTTREWIANNPEKLDRTMMVIQWTTWEREEWLHNGTWYQVNASGIDWVPKELEQRYKEFVVSVDWNVKTVEAHEKIWRLHLELEQLGVRHVFFSGHSTFSDIQDQRDWGVSYMDPYDRNKSFNAVLKNNGFDYVNPQSYHFGADAHSFWASYVLQYLHQHQLLHGFDAIPTN
jgi:hypothetical protein